ncbi:MAG: histidinol-phosphate transaminase [Proteobacteria bacterium]|nr:histidinol-phosphate transaminase [Pseudomonadota bacterium]MDA0992981.1 histidinol-phosphate transaminase [Pseudomonadota bacterium]
MQLNRRDVMRAMVSGAVSLAFAQGTFAQHGPPPGKIALRFNENPYGPSASALKAAAKALEMGAYYPISITDDLLNAISTKNGVALENMVLSSGSNEALQAAFVAWGKKGKVLLPALTYTDHIAYSIRMGVELVTVPLAKDMSIDLEAMAAAVDDGVSLVYICNPNNPTGMALDGDLLRHFCRTVGKKATVIIDEAYNELTDEPDYTSMIDLVREDENVVVMRTFSKIFGMAGLRVGYGMARPDLASIISGHVMAWPNGPGLAAAYASYNDDEFIRFSRAKVIEGRNMVNETFRKNGIEPLPSQANFVYADIGRNATLFQKRMNERDILIRGSFELYPNYSRVSMGKLEDLETFDRVFTEVYNS